MNPRTKLVVGSSLFLLASIACTIILSVVGDLSWWGAFIAAWGTLLSSSLGTYTVLDAQRLPVEHPGGIREWFLHDGTQPISPWRWRGFVVTRSVGYLTIVAGFGLALVSTISALEEANANGERMLRMQEQISELSALPVVRESRKQLHRQAHDSTRSRSQARTPNGPITPAMKTER